MLRGTRLERGLSGANKQNTELKETDANAHGGKAEKGGSGVVPGKTQNTNPTQGSQTGYRVYLKGQIVQVTNKSTPGVGDGHKESQTLRTLNTQVPQFSLSLFPTNRCHFSILNNKPLPLKGRLHALVNPQEMRTKLSAT